MIGVIAVEARDVLHYDEEKGKLYLRVQHYGHYSGLCSIFTTEGSTVEEAQEKGAKRGKRVLVGVNGGISFDSYR